MNQLQGNCVRTLTSGHDFTYGNNLSGYLQQDAAAIQQVSCRILQVLTECFWDQNAGINWFGWLQSFDPQGLALALSTVILNTQNVLKVNSTDFDLSVERVFTVNWSVDTVFSQNVTGSVRIPSGG